jgi:putative ABC transport system permease protein
VTPFRFARREIRHRPGTATLFALSVGFGATAIMALGAFGGAVRRSVGIQARELWAADITVDAAPAVLDEAESWARARWPDLRATRSVTTLSMARLGGRAVSVTLKAVGPGYPLYGKILALDGRPLTQVLTAGAVLAGANLSMETGAKVGDGIRLGDRTFRIAGVIGERTDAPTSFFELSPSVLLTLEDLARTGLLAPGSRAKNTLYMNLPPTADPASALNDLRAFLGDRAETASWSTDNPGSLRFIERTIHYLDFLALLILALGGVGVATAASAAQTAARRDTAVVLALGVPRGFLLRAWGWWAGGLAAIGVAGALVAGRGVAALLLKLYGDLLPGSFALGFPTAALARAGAVGLASTGVFVLWPLLRRSSVSPATLFAEEPPVVIDRRRDALLLLSALGLFYLVVWAQVGRPVTAAVYVAGLGAVLAASTVLVHVFLRLSRRVLLARSGITARLAARGLDRPGQLNDAVGVAIAVSLGMILALFLLERNLTDQLVRSFPADAPNVFFINVQRDQREAVAQRVAEVAGSELRLFPLVRGRVVAVNDRPVHDVAARSEKRRGPGDRLTREFGFTYGEELLPTDTVTDGSLWDDSLGDAQVSVFDDYRKRFGLRRGDRITVNVLGRRFTATVSSFRTIDQTVRRPFFYFYFRPGLLDDVPATWMGGAPVPRDRVAPLKDVLAEAFPNVTTVDLSDVAALTGRLLARLGRVVNAVGVLGLGSGFLLLVANLAASLAARTREAVLFRTLGATRRQVTAVALAEYGILALVSAGTALVVGTGSTAVVLRLFMELAFHGNVVPTMVLAGGAAALLVGLSWAVTRRALGRPVWEVLRHE